MKTISTFLIAMLVFAAVPAFAGTCGGGGGGCDKDKDQQAFTIDAQYLCGGGDKGSDEADKTCSKPKTDEEPKCGGDKADKPAPQPTEPSVMCGGDKDGEDKGKTCS